MNWERAIEINRERLLAVLAGILVVGGGTVSREGRKAVLALLRPAEAAARRLIAIAARGMVVAPSGRGAPAVPVPRGTGWDVPAFRLFDPRRRVGPVPSGDLGVDSGGDSGGGPRIRGFDGPECFTPALPGPAPADPVDAAPLHRRLAALRHALDTIPAQARRLARAMARRALPMRAMRPGRPPGYRHRPPPGGDRREMHAVLIDCHALALHALAPP